MIKICLDFSLFIPIPGALGYFVKKDGKGDGIWRLRQVYGVWMFLWCEEHLDENGYRRAHYAWRGNPNSWFVHLGIYAAFKGLPPPRYFVHHDNKIKTDCRICNLILRHSKLHNTIDHDKPGQMMSGRGPWKPRYRDPRTGRFNGGELPPEVSQ